MSDGNAFVYTERDMRAIIQAERERIARAIEALPTWVIGDKATLAVDRFDAARIARNGGSDG